MLFIGCFIAGFSEKLVPNLLFQHLSKMAVEPPQTPKVPSVPTVSPAGRNQGRSEGDTGG